MDSASHITVSVVIPTRNRPSLVTRAVASALSQTYAAVEVCVVVDGPDDVTISALQQITDRRLQIVRLPQNVGGASARNVGVRNARGRWVAFLDDDDEWLPKKLEKQMMMAVESSYEYPILSSSIIARTPYGEFLWPRKSPSAPLSEYLLARSSWTQGEGVMQTSTLLTKRELLLRVPFQDGLRKHQDWDWLLRSVALPGTGIEFVEEPLAIWNVEEKRATVSTTSDWRYSLEWIRQSRLFVTKRAYSGFVATQLSSQAAEQGSWNAFVPLLREIICEGQPKPIDFCLYFGMWLVPGRTRRWVRSWANRNQLAVANQRMTGPTMA